MRRVLAGIVEHFMSDDMAVWRFRWSRTVHPRFLHQLSCVSVPADRKDFELMRAAQSRQFPGWGEQRIGLIDVRGMPQQ